MWEPVLPTDWGAPSTAALKRVGDPRAAQFWDNRRLVSRAMGEHDKKSIVWDYIGVYKRGVVWKQGLTEPLYGGGPVIDVIESARAAIVRALAIPHP